MFENVATQTSRTLYALVMTACVAVLAWLCLTKLPLLGALVAFCMGLPLLALVAAPLVAGASMLVGVLAGLLASVGSSARRVRSGG